MTGRPSDIRPVEERVDAGDRSLFDPILTQASPNDKSALLALQAAAAQLNGTYRYLEIGSYRGGSLQPHVRDPRCVGVVSIDERVFAAADGRGAKTSYQRNDTATMLDSLRELPGADVSKVTTFDQRSDQIPSESLPWSPDLCFIDGEHTDEAVRRDGHFAVKAVNGHGTLVFHDVGIVFIGLRDLISDLAQAGVEFRPYFLPDQLLCIDVGTSRLADLPMLEPVFARAYEGLINCLVSNVWYRQAATGGPHGRFLRSAPARWLRARLPPDSRMAWWLGVPVYGSSELRARRPSRVGAGGRPRFRWRA